MSNAHLQGLVSLNNRAKAVLTGLAVGALGLCLTTTPAVALEPHALTAGLGAPQLQHVSSDDSSITLDFFAPVNDGGSAIFGYEDSIDGGLTWQPLSPAGSDEMVAVITGLHNGTSYSVQLRATSDAGPGAVATTDLLTPSKVPGAPTAASALATDSGATVSFSGPVDNGGAEVIDYQYSLNGGEWTPFVQAGSLARPGVASQFVESVTGLTNGSVYALRVRAVNVRGGGAATEPVSVAPHAVPLTLTGPSAAVVPVGRVVPVSGQAPAGATVQILFRQRGQANFVVRRTLVAAADNTFVTAYTANDDYQYYARSGSTVSASVLTKVAPTIAGPTSLTVKRNSVVVVSGTGVVGSTVELHFHKQGSAATDYSIVRDVVVSANGTWTRSYTAALDYRFFATSRLNNTASATHLVQAH